jgi:hypothetical protein
MKPKRQATCCPDKPHAAKGLCDTHYRQKLNETGPRATCHPKRRRYTEAGECHPCYERRREKEVVPRAKCHPERFQVTADGLCDTCYRKWLVDNGPRATCHPECPRYILEGLCKPCWRRRKLYRMEPHQYDTMLANQGGRCAVRDCKAEPTDVDHCHKTGVVRGLLCNQHNRVAGQANDDPVILRNTAEYLEKHQAA